MRLVWVRKEDSRDRWRVMNLPTKENMAAEIRPILSPKLRRPAASAERVTVKLSHDRTARFKEEAIGWN